jgi:hypothetical protein
VAFLCDAKLGSKLERVHNRSILVTHGTMEFHNTTEEIETVLVECCRGCEFKYNFKLENHEIATVLCGEPEAGVQYKAVSYLWEDVSRGVHLSCRACSRVKWIPMRDSKKLLEILNFVRGGCNVWLDAMSIDQDDPEDKKAQIMIMGYIYRQAETASVFLPQSDNEAYERLKELASTSNTIVQCLGDVTINTVENRMATDPNFGASMLALAPAFSISLAEFEKITSKWLYGSRAWTFQEWARAAEIEITYEGIYNNGVIQNIKNLIVMASTIVGQYKMQSCKNEPLVDQVRLREENGMMLNRVSALFPFRDFLIADDEEAPDTQRGLTCLSPLHSIDGGTYVHPHRISGRASELRSLLLLALTAMSLSKRRAGYEADLVACWASMCNISYAYSPEDGFAIALHKVVTVLRQRGFRIYNFHVNATGGETDLKFMEYAAATRMSNGVNQPYLSGSPILVGRVDTLAHLKHCFETPAHLQVLPTSFDVALQTIDNSTTSPSIDCSNKVKLLSNFRDVVTGTADNDRVVDVVGKIEELLSKLSLRNPGQLEKYVMVPISIKVNELGIDWAFPAWGICHSNTNMSDIFVARESLNGTLVLARHTLSGETEIICYVNMTHQRHGTYLVKCDENGTVDIAFRKADPEMHSTNIALSLEAFLADPLGAPMPSTDQLFDINSDMLGENLGSQEILEVTTNIKVDLAKKEYCLSRGSLQERKMDQHGPDRFIQRRFQDEDIESGSKPRTA